MNRVLDEVQIPQGEGVIFGVVQPIENHCESVTVAFYTAKK